MPEVELEPDRNRLHDLVRLVWQSAQPAGAGGGSPAPDEGRAAVTDEDIAAAGPYSLAQVRAHLDAEQAGTYVLERDGEALTVLSVEDA